MHWLAFDEIQLYHLLTKIFFAGYK